ncbi:MAG: glycosyltransferase family 2 protein [Candidatus Saganbacteria bacterium]|nr:glycosyltransferase family 2 protein [Candidatus Saganbacteria bacterium]
MNLKKIKSNPSVFIIILNWNGGTNLLECLSSLQQIKYPDFQIVVVDNFSSDNSLESAKAGCPDLIYLENKENLGFAEGNNTGIRYALKNGADYVLLLNNDAVVTPDFLGFLIDSRPDIACPKIYYYNSKKIWYGGGFLNKLTGFTYHRGEGQLDFDKNAGLEEVDFASGCCIMIRRLVFDKIGLLDADYYHSHEDADFCLRAKKAGFRCSYVPTSMVYHKLAVSSGGRRSPFYLYYRTRNHLLFKHKLKLNAPLFWPKFISLVLKRFFGSFLFGSLKGASATLQGIIDFYKQRWGVGNGEKFR